MPPVAVMLLFWAFTVLDVSWRVPVNVSGLLMVSVLVLLKLTLPVTLPAATVVPVELFKYNPATVAPLMNVVVPLVSSNVPIASVVRTLNVWPVTPREPVVKLPRLLMTAVAFCNVMAPGAVMLLLFAFRVLLLTLRKLVNVSGLFSVSVLVLASVTLSLTLPTATVDAVPLLIFSAEVVSLALNPNVLLLTASAPLITSLPVPRVMAPVPEPLVPKVRFVAVRSKLPSATVPEVPSPLPR